MFRKKIWVSRIWNQGGTNLNSNLGKLNLEDPINQKVIILLGNPLATFSHKHLAQSS